MLRNPKVKTKEKPTYFAKYHQVCFALINFSSTIWYVSVGSTICVLCAYNRLEEDRQRNLSSVILRVVSVLSKSIFSCYTLNFNFEVVEINKKPDLRLLWSKVTLRFKKVASKL